MTIIDAELQSVFINIQLLNVLCDTFYDQRKNGVKKT